MRHQTAPRPPVAETELQAGGPRPRGSPIRSSLYPGASGGRLVQTPPPPALLTPPGPEASFPSPNNEVAQGHTTGGGDLTQGLGP